MPAQSPLYCSVIGCGEPVIFVHGDFLYGSPVDHWRSQVELADEFQLIMLARHGCYLSPPAEQETFDVYADAIAHLLGNGAHLVGQSYGGLLALLAAARRPEAVYSLTVNEPPAFSLALGHPEVKAFISSMQNKPASTSPITPDEFILHFSNAFSKENRTELTPRQQEMLASPYGRRNVEANMREPSAWEAEIPLGKLAQTLFPKLVFSSRSDPKHEVICEVLVQRLGAQHTVISEAGHAIPRTGKPYNDRLRAFLRAASVEQKALCKEYQ